MIDSTKKYTVRDFKRGQNKDESFCRGEYLLFGIRFFLFERFYAYT
jgi:hypothetical protein